MSTKVDLKEKLYSCIESACIKRDSASDCNTYDTLVAPLFTKCIANISGATKSVEQMKIVVYAINKVCKLYDNEMQLRLAMLALAGDGLDGLEIEHLMMKQEFRKDRDNFKRAYQTISENESYNELCKLILGELDNLERTRKERTRKMNLGVK